MIRGSCLCRGVGFEATEAPDALAHCHCSMCRKSHGVAFGTFGLTSAAGFRWLGGEDLIRPYESSPGTRRAFCATCGSSLPTPFDDTLTTIPVGLVDGDPGGRPAMHLFAASRAPWWAIQDGLPQHDAYPPGYDVPSFSRQTRGTPDPGLSLGGCLCGDVLFEIAGEHDTFVCCHCVRCQKARAAAHATNLFVPADRFRWLRGEDRVDRFKVPEAERFTQAFCRRCGSIMPVVRNVAVVPMGGLDDDPGARPGLHIWVDSMAPWDAIHDGLARHAQAPG